MPLINPMRFSKFFTTIDFRYVRVNDKITSPIEIGWDHFINDRESFILLQH